MSLARALERLSADSATELALRDVLVLFSRHTDEWLTADEVARKTGHGGADITPLLDVLARSYVLDFDDDAPRYRFGGDVVLSLEIDSFVRHVRAHREHMETNVAKYRQRFGS
ncbi:MAG: hypothetical protein Kow0067_15790 [Coriobacteriia bacterium]